MQPLRMSVVLAMATATALACAQAPTRPQPPASVPSATSPATAPAPFSLSLSYYNAKMRQMGQPPVLSYGEGFMLIDVKWPSSFTEKDDVSYRVWISGDRDWASANTPQGTYEADQRGWRQYAYTGSVREGASKGTRMKFEPGYRPPGLSSYPLGDAAASNLVPLPEAMPLPPGKYSFTVCAQRTIAGSAPELATQPLEMTVSGDTAAGAVYGIAANQVFQRSGKDKGPISFKLLGRVQGSPWKATAKRDSEVIGFASGVFAGSAADTIINDVPVGGPYTVEVTAAGRTRTFESIYIGDIWLISGQSNAVGCGYDLTLGAKAMPGVQCLEPRYGVQEWTVARDGLFQQTVGPWVTAAQQFYGETKVPVGIVGQASGSMPMDYFLVGGNPYFLRPLIERHGKGAAAFFWYQGESDSFSPEAAQAYPNKLKTLIQSVRKIAGNAQMMVGVCQLGRYTWHKDDHFAAMREIQRQFVLQDPRAALYSTLPYEVNKSDKIHLVTEGYIALGKQIGAQMVAFERTGKVQSPGPILRQAALADDKTIEVRFDNGTGLQSSGSPDEWFVTDETRRGFRDGGFVPLAAIEVDAANARVLLRLAEPLQGNASVSYGYRSDVGGTLANGAGHPAACFVKSPVIRPGR